MRVDDLLAATPLPRNEAEILLASMLEKDRTWIMAHPEALLPEAQVKEWKALERRRLRGEPIAYIRGTQEFYGRTFHVESGILIPRPATEGLVDVALTWLHEPADIVVPTDAGIVCVSRTFRAAADIHTVVDMGTGSGAIAVTLALERPDVTVISTDISDDALRVARLNAERHGVADRITFRRGSLLEPVSDLTTPFLLVSNPPYVKSDRQLLRDITDFEPHEAIFAGPEGLDVITPLIEQARKHSACCGFVVECEEGQVSAIV